MKELKVNLGEKTYSVIITKGFADLVKYIPNVQRAIVITDRNVGKYYLEELVDELQEVYSEVLSYVVEPGEDSKSYEVLRKIYDFFISNNLCRYDLVFSLGGGVLGDLAGFAAATFMRGISFINVPTSLLAQIDSSIGGKTAINFGKTKNVIGAFYQPKLVYINTEVLNTLPTFEIKNGLIEIIVHAIIKDEKLFEYIEQNLDHILQLDEDCLEELVFWNCSIKGSVVEEDELDQGERAILNFGHTFGHAIESTYEYQYSHGQCVALGIISACFLAIELNLIDRSVLNRISNLLMCIGIFPDVMNCDVDKLFEYMRHDKKSVSDSLYFILPSSIGKVMKYEIKDLEVVKTAFNNSTYYIHELLCKDNKNK